MPKSRDALRVGRGAFRVRRMVGVTLPGARGKANVGMSNDKGGVIPPRRKTKVSRAMPISPGSVGP